MVRFDSIYPFTTENIAGYMRNIDLVDKSVITVTGSSDHIFNLIVKGVRKITTFDVNPYTEDYLYLQAAAFDRLDYKEFLKIFLYDNEKSFDYDVISKLEMPDKSRRFWLNELDKCEKNGLILKKSELFLTKYFNPNSKLKQNLYLSEEGYECLRRRIGDVDINFINCNLSDLKVVEDYDYMFLSNISDYLNLMYEDNLLENYKKLIDGFSSLVSNIYFAYLYDIYGSKCRSVIDDVDRVREVFGDIGIEIFDSALEGCSNKKDGVLIYRRNFNG